VRASDQGFLPIQVEHYVMLLDWTGRELRADKRGAIPDHLAPIMDRLGLNRSNWVETVRGFGRLFKQAARRPSSLVDAAARCSRCWFSGKAAARTAFVYDTGSTQSRKQTSALRFRFRAWPSRALNSLPDAVSTARTVQLPKSSDHAHDGRLDSVGSTTHVQRNRLRHAPSFPTCPSRR
jgi:hypothetical protein